MKIYAEQSNIIFECDYCEKKEVLSPKKSKRAFMIRLMPFYRDHDWRCKDLHRRQQRINESADTTTQIIDKLRDKCL